MAGCHVDRWDDRDRIVLLHEYIVLAPQQPDGSHYWEERIVLRAADLYAEGRESWRGRPFRMDWRDFENDEAPGWRMLTSLPSCPNPHMRFPMSRAMLQRVQNHGA